MKEVMSDANFEEVLNTIEKQSKEMEDAELWEKQIEEIKATEFPVDTLNLRIILIEQYKFVLGLIKENRKTPMYHVYWEVWSGAFNRHIRLLQKETWEENSPDSMRGKLVFVTWSACHRLLQEYLKPRVLRKKAPIKKNVRMVADFLVDFNNTYKNED